MIGPAIEADNFRRCALHRLNWDHKGKFSSIGFMERLQTKNPHSNLRRFRKLNTILGNRNIGDPDIDLSSHDRIFKFSRKEFVNFDTCLRILSEESARSSRLVIDWECPSTDSKAVAPLSRVRGPRWLISIRVHRPQPIDNRSLLLVVSVLLRARVGKFEEALTLGRESLFRRRYKSSEFDLYPLVNC